MSNTKKRNVTISLTEEEYNSLKSEADDLSLPLSNYVRQKALGIKVRPAPPVMEEAFRRLDESDYVRESRGEPALPPEPPRTPFKILNLAPAWSAQQHPCLHHQEVERTDGGPPKVCGLGGGQRPCYWPSAGAKDCLTFAPRG